jgi:hypothetical protein
MIPMGFSSIISTSSELCIEQFSQVSGNASLLLIPQYNTIYHICFDGDRLDLHEEIAPIGLLE